jgi:hypothetical protein
MGSWRRNDVHDVKSFSSQQFFVSAIALDPRNDAFHRSLGDIGRICHRGQLSISASQDCARMLLCMTAPTKERDPKSTGGHSS